MLDIKLSAYEKMTKDLVYSGRYYMREGKAKVSVESRTGTGCVSWEHMNLETKFKP
jgi:hypothetical protein